MALIQPTRLETQKCLFGLGDVVNLMISEIKRRPFDLATHVVSLIWSRLVSMNFGTCLESPCLMFSQNSSNSWKIFHSGYNDLYIFDFPELEGAEIHFSKDGWLLMGVDECPLFFFNPSTRAKFVLPPTPCSFISVCFTSPPTSSSCCVFGLLSDSTGFEFCYGVIKFGDDEWRLGRWETRHFFAISNCPPLFCNGVYYLLDSLSTSIIEYDPAKEDDNAWKHSFLVHINRNVDNEEEEDTSSFLVHVNRNEDNGDEHEENGEEEVEEDTNDGGDIGEENEEDEVEEDIVHEMYMVEVAGEIWAVFLRNRTGNVRVEKLDLSEMQWKKLDTLGGICLYLSNNGSFAETCVDGDTTDMIYFDRFYRKNGVVYCMKSRMYYSIGGDFASKELDGNVISNNI